jgi:capsule polysaccharide export protein KpsE/RkpR
MNEREIAQLQIERDQAVARLRVANGHTEDATRRATALQGEIEVLRRQLSKTHDRAEEMQRDWLAERAAKYAEQKDLIAAIASERTEAQRVSTERDEARFWAKKYQRVFKLVHSRAVMVTAAEVNRPESFTKLAIHCEEA